MAAILAGAILQSIQYIRTPCRSEDIHRYLRLDDKRNRVFREATNHLAAFRYVWDIFLENCRGRFIPNDFVTVDEQLSSRHDTWQSIRSILVSSEQRILFLIV